MTRAYAGLGSNIDKEINITAGLKVLASHFSPLDRSTVYESEPLGFRGDNYYNLVVGFDTDLSEQDVIRIFKEIEVSFGRKKIDTRKNESGFASHTLDIDLLLFGDLVRHDENVNVPREDIVLYPFVLCPLAEIAGELEHPETGLYLSDMWQAFDKDKHHIEAVDF